MAKRVISSLNLPQEFRTRLQYGYDQVVNGKDSVLHFSFKALEKTEYVLTAMKVFQNQRRLERAGRPGLDPEMEKALVGRVLVIDLTKVLDVYAPEFPNSIGLLLKNSANLIDQMFAFSIPWLVSHNEWRGKPSDHGQAAMMFQSAWIHFKRDNLK